MNTCLICLEKKCKYFNNYKCVCNAFICNKCTNKLFSVDSIYIICPHCRYNRPFILKNKICKNFNFSKKYNILFLKNILISLIIWYIILNIIGYFTISEINYSKIIIDKDEINIFLFYLLLQPLIGSLTLIIVILLFICIFIS